MVKEKKYIDISDIPELVSLAEEVQRTNKPLLLRQNDEDLAILTPVKPVKGSKDKPIASLLHA